MKQTKEWKVYLVESLGYTAFYGTPISWEIHNGLQHDTFGIVYQFHRFFQEPSGIRNLTLGKLHAAFPL